MPTLETNGARLYYEVSGEPRNDRYPIIFIHAGIANLTMWDYQFKMFAPDGQLVRYDTRGFGRTETEDVAYSNRADLIALMDHLGLEKALVVGCSRGGMIALDTALEFPDRIAGLMMVCSQAGGFEIPLPEEQEAVFNRLDGLYNEKKIDELSDGETDVWFVGFHRTREQVSPELYAYVRQMIYENNLKPESGTPIPLEPMATTRLGEVNIPVLVVIGALDTAQALAAADDLEQSIAGARKVTIQQAAHLPNLEQPDEFNGALADFVTSVTP